ncbi:MAG: hypothetical protein COC19_04630 [SAR86 cluster bacterium]|uniref:N-acetyltransferase domain-containing protein n=1 Tax=SAR86 cluster bacterium TaxID=2030880 RepID=A0A2A4MNS6_9GAMM|nr:MAG: hypothetical protein COC19_04630 [SAR86 cluster bacterium]
MEIVSLRESSGSPYIKELRELLEQEWDKFAPFDGEECDIKPPPPILAIRNAELLGGLVFSLWPNPETEVMSIWINGLIVKPRYRRQGVAGSLISAAMQNQTPLLVLTDIERLYRRKAWLVVSSSAKGVVLQHGQ